MFVLYNETKWNVYMRLLLTGLSMGFGTKMSFKVQFLLVPLTFSGGRFCTGMGAVWNKTWILATYKYIHIHTQLKGIFKVNIYWIIIFHQRFNIRPCTIYCLTRTTGFKVLSEWFKVRRIWSVVYFVFTPEWNSIKRIYEIPRQVCV